MNLQLDVTSPKGWGGVFLDFGFLTDIFDQILNIYSFTVSIARLNKLHLSEKEVHFSTLKGALIL